MGYNNPAFVDDDNKTSNTKPSVEQNGKNDSSATNGNAYDVVNTRSENLFNTRCRHNFIDSKMLAFYSPFFVSLLFCFIDAEDRIIRFD